MARSSPLLLLSVALLVSFSLASPPLVIEELPRFYDLKAGVISNKDGIAPSEVTKTDGLIPNSIDPETYNVLLRPILLPEGSPEEWTAPGIVVIVGKAINTTNRIILHRHESLKIDTATVQVLNQANVNIATTFEDPANAPIFTINLSANLVVGQTYTISMSFVASINDGSSGLYQGFYTAPDGTTRRFATTQFEATGARQAFPCFDEPRFNSNFTISLARNSKDVGYNTLCNTNQVATGVPDASLPTDWVYDHYAPTVKMPTYLIAMVISDFTYEVAESSLFDKPVRVYGPPHLISRDGGVYPAEASARVMKDLETIFTHKYEMPKVDSVAVPRDYFAAGAMENWGLITYRDNYLLYYTGESVETERQQITSVIVHEQAHQWFGNLVTCKYWSHIWLNEGFATYVAQLGMSRVYPEFEQRKEFLFGSVQRSMASDVGPYQPILNLDADLDQQTSPGIIIYDKGGSIIRMMEGFLGYETLIEALTDYLGRYAYGSAEQDELFNTMHEHVKHLIPADKTFKEIMDTWTTQPGFPLIRVSKVGNERVYISQERYAPVGEQPPQTGLWEVPLPIVTEDSAEFSNHTAVIWLSKDTLIKSFNHDTSKWILLNPDAFGYYRVMYDDALLQLLHKQLGADRDRISELSRSQLIDDYFSFYNLGHVPITRALETTRYLEAEKEFVVWYPVFNHLLKTQQMFSSQDTSSLKDYLVPKLDSTLAIVGLDQPKPMEGTAAIFRSKLLDWACALESDLCKTHAEELRVKWEADTTNPIAVDLQPVYYCAIVAYATDGFDFITAKFNTETSAFQKARLLNALSCSSDATELNNLLENALTLDPYNKNTVSIFQAVARTRQGREFLLEANQLKNRFDQLKTATGGVSAFRDIVSTLSTYVNVPEQRQNLQALITEKAVELESVMPALNRSLDSIAANVDWVTNVYPIVDGWFTISK